MAKYVSERESKLGKFNFEKMKSAATSGNAAVRKQIFIEYFERFEEFPSYLFDNEEKMDDRLFETTRDILKDPDTPEAMRKGVEALIQRLSSR